VRVRYSNAHVWLPDGEIADSLVVEDGWITSSTGEVDSEIDCGGNTIWPAFVDGHAHPLLGGRELHGPQINNLDSIEAICATIRDWLEQQDDFQDWLVCGSYDRSLVSEGRFRAEWLDDVSRDIPIVVHANDHHSIWVNTRALELAGLDLVPEHLEGFIDHVNFRPTGVLREDKAKALVLARVVERPGLDTAALLAAHLKLASLGITSVLDAWVDADGAQTYLNALASANGNKILQTRLAYWLQRATWKDDLNSALAYRDEFGECVQDVRLTQAKFFIDGVFGSETALVKHPYQDGSFGYSPWQATELREAIQACVQVGLRPHLHVIGDQAVEMALAAVEHVARVQGWFESTLVHAELLQDEQILKIESLGLSVNLQPLWGRCDSMWNSTAAVLGERAHALYRTKDLIYAGVQLGFGSDWPVSDANPFAGIFTAVTRRKAIGEQPQNESQAIQIQQAIDAYTQGSAHQIGLQNRGTLTVGMRADFIVIEGNVLETSIAEFPNLQVLETVSGGQSIFARH
jgi:predicted amidohydrolase YtcJ